MRFIDTDGRCETPRGGAFGAACVWMFVLAVLAVVVAKVHRQARAAREGEREVTEQPSATIPVR